MFCSFWILDLGLIWVLAFDFGGFMCLVVGLFVRRFDCVVACYVGLGVLSWRLVFCVGF